MSQISFPADMSRRKLALLVGGVLAALLVGLLILLGLRGGDDNTIASGTTVAGVDIGGLDRQGAIDKLNAELLPRSTEPVRLLIAGRKARITPQRAGLSVDIPATVDQALENPTGLSVLTGREIRPVLDVQHSKLNATVKSLAQKYDRKVVEGGIRYDGLTPVTVTPVSGVNVDAVGSAQAIRNGYLGSEPVKLPADVTKPKIGEEDVERVLAEVAQPAVSGPITFVDGDRRVQLSPSDFVPFLSFTATDSGTLQLQVAGEKLVDALDERLGTQAERPVPASFRVVNGRPEIVPSRPGRAIDADAMTARFTEVLRETGTREVQLVRTDAQPSFTTEDARALGINEQLSTHTQEFPYAPYRAQNIGTAARYINGTLLKPGDLFSMNTTIKERIPANGYTEGIIIKDGRFARELGGGVSAVATTLWTNAFYSGLERVEQRAHSLYISRYKAGLEATISYPHLDLKFRNDSPNGIFMVADATRTSVTISFWGTKRYSIKEESGPRTNIKKPQTVYDPSETCEGQNGVEGFDITVKRLFYPPGGGDLIKSESLTSKYAVTNEVVCEEPPEGGSTASPEPRKPGRRGRE